MLFMDSDGRLGPTDLFFLVEKGGLVWSAPNAGALSWREWDGFYVVFNPASLEMHILDLLARELIDIIAETPCSNEAVFAEMEKLFEQKLNPDLVDKITNSLIKLDDIGLITPSQPCSTAL